MFPLHDFNSQNRVLETRFQSGILKKKKKQNSSQEPRTLNRGFKTQFQH